MSRRRENVSAQKHSARLAVETIKVESPDFDPGAGRCEIRPYRSPVALAPARSIA